MYNVPYFCLNKRFKKIIWEELHHDLPQHQRTYGFHRTKATIRQTRKANNIILEDDDENDAISQGISSDEKNDIPDG